MKKGVERNYPNLRKWNLTRSLGKLISKYLNKSSGSQTHKKTWGKFDIFCEASHPINCWFEVSNEVMFLGLVLPKRCAIWDHVFSHLQLLTLQKSKKNLPLLGFSKKKNMKKKCPMAAFLLAPQSWEKKNGKKNDNLVPGTEPNKKDYV